MRTQATPAEVAQWRALRDAKLTYPQIAALTGRGLNTIKRHLARNRPPRIDRRFKDISDCAVVAAYAEHGSYAAAARALGVSKTLIKDRLDKTRGATP